MATIDPYRCTDNRPQYGNNPYVIRTTNESKPSSKCPANENKGD